MNIHASIPIQLTLNRVKLSQTTQNHHTNKYTKVYLFTIWITVSRLWVANMIIDLTSPFLMLSSKKSATLQYMADVASQSGLIGSSQCCSWASRRSYNGKLHDIIEVAFREWSLDGRSVFSPNPAQGCNDHSLESFIILLVGQVDIPRYINLYYLMLA